MTKDPKTMTCNEFQDQLSDLVGSGANVSSHPHLQTCELCRALLRTSKPSPRLLGNCCPFSSLKRASGNGLNRPSKKRTASLIRQTASQRRR